MTICVNCLQDTRARPTEVGPVQGSQRDPWRQSILLCDPCQSALLGGDLATFHARYQAEKLVTRTTTD